ncbi:hypothetical protein ACHAXR_002542 [Thalassiosira sp. AJA248-18]
MSDLDESRRHGVPIDPRNPHPPPQLSTLNENRSLSDERLTNGWHPKAAEYSLHQQHSPPSAYHVPQHLQHHQAQPVTNQQPDRIREQSCSTAKDLDGELSGLQAAAAKTALLINGEATGSSLEGEVVTTEEDDDNQSSHWIFRKHVGFSNLNETKTILHRPPPSSQVINQEQHRKGVSNHRYQQQSAKSNASKSALSPETGTAILAKDSDQQTEKSRLLQQLTSLRKQRQHLEQNISPTICQHLNEWNFRLSSTQHSHKIALSSLEAVCAKRIWAEEEYQFACCKLHVLGDVFFIWHRGPFGTINGFRLGKSATTMVGLVKKCAGGSSSGSGGSGAGSAGQSGNNGAPLFSWGASENKNGAAASRTPQTTNAKNANGNTASNPNNSIPEKVIIPWTEINSALGQVVFLLYTLQNAPYSGISFRKHILQPCGSSSKIGVLKKNPAQSSTSAQQPRNERRRITALAAYYNTDATDTASRHITQPTSPASKPSRSSVPAPLPGDVTWYNLHHYEENGSLLSMGYYARRNFNTALEGLLYCIAEACFVVEKRDMALAAPYIMRVDGFVVGKDVHGNDGVVSGVKDGEATVGGLPLAYDPAASGEQWTMACKYLLTNLKWLITYVAKHVDR